MTPAIPADGDERYRSVVDNSPYGIYRVTSTGEFVTVNPALCRIVGFSEHELFASNIGMLYQDPAERARLLAEFESRPYGVPVETSWRRKDGEVIIARIWVYGERSHSGRIKYLDGYVEDVTHMRATERALLQAEKLAALGQLVSGVAHELNNPLSAILLFAEDLLVSERRSEEREALAIIAQQARRSRAIVRDLLSFVRSREVIREPVESDKFLEQIARTLQPQLGELGVTLHLESPPSSPLIHVERAGIEQVITNLVINGAQAAGPGGSVRVTASQEARYFVVEVTDDGRGIPADVLPRIFEPFFTTKPMGQGTGLGLSVSLGVVQQHGGTLIAENRDTPEGPGARFTVRLPMPARSAVTAPADESDPAPVAVPLRRVLIVDDEVTIRQALSRFYGRRGWNVTEAEDGAQASDRLISAGESYDLVVSDVKMPRVSGIELHAALREVRPELLDRLLFCTGEAESPAVAAFVAETSCRVLLKPFDLRTLASVSDEIIALAALAVPVAAVVVE
ncbi:MAG: ATP-binding protein [bacterium]